MKALVTGATGHVGSNLVRLLRDRGWDVAVFVRRSSDRRGLAKLEVEERVGDLLDEGSLRRAMDGAEVVFHAGAVHRNYSPDPDTITGPAIEGTRNVLQAATKNKVRRLVYTSTAATIGFSEDPGAPLDESHSLESASSAYIHGKIEAERLVRRHATTADAPEVVILNPSGIFGPFDYRLTPATRGMVSLLQGDPIFFHMCVTDVRDVAQAHLAAAERGEPGERYILTGEQLSPTAIGDNFHAITGIRPKTFRPPGWLLRFLAGRMERKAARTGTDAAVTRGALEDLGHGHLAYDASRSREQLGMSYRPTEKVLTDTFRWLLHMNALKPKVAKRVRGALGAKAAPDPEWR